MTTPTSAERIPTPPIDTPRCDSHFREAQDFDRSAFVVPLEYARTLERDYVCAIDVLMLCRAQLAEALAQRAAEPAPPPPAAGGDERAQFEAWVKHEYGHVPHQTQYIAEWKAWQARAARSDAGDALCDWTEDSDGTWNTGCGHAWVFDDGSPADNGCSHCCFCGGKLLQCSYQDAALAAPRAGG